MTVESHLLERGRRTDRHYIDSTDFILNLGLLNGCQHSCYGCFVDKRGEAWPIQSVLKQAHTVAEGMSRAGWRLREVILGPTDFLSAANTPDILKNSLFQELFHFHPETHLAVPCIFSPLNRERFGEIFKLLDNPVHFKKDLMMEFLVLLDIKKILGQDATYMRDNFWVIDFFKHHTPKIIEWFYLINMHKDILLRHRYIDLMGVVAKKFETIMEFSPGFFRLQNRQFSAKILKSWKDFLQALMEREDYEGMCFADWDKEHNTANTIFLNFTGGQVYFSPFVYEQIVDTSELLRVKELNGDSILGQHQELLKLGFEYARQTDQCAECEHLVACVGRNVLNMMQLQGARECWFPHQLRPKYAPHALASM